MLLREGIYLNKITHRFRFIGIFEIKSEDDWL